MPERTSRFPSDQITAFSEWERRGRGWQTWDYSVRLEPPFTPVEFKPRIIGQVHDDAKLHSSIQRLFVSNQSNVAPIVPHINGLIETILPQAHYRIESPVELRIRLSDDLEILPGLTEQFFLSLSSCKTPISFELIAGAEAVTIQMACDPGLVPYLTNQLRTFFPGLLVDEVSKSQRLQFASHDGLAIADFGLSRNFLLPLLTVRRFEPDPLMGILSSLDSLHGSEKAVFQVLFQSAESGWSEEIQRLSANPDCKELLQTSTSGLKEKLSTPLFAVAVRVAVECNDPTRSWHILRNIGAGLSCFSSPNGNELIALSNDAVTPNNHLLAIMYRTTYRSGMLLNVSELAGIAHLPTVRISKLDRFKNNTKAAPKLFALEGDIVLGSNSHHGTTQSVKLSDSERMKHIWLLGASGSGKSSLITNLVEQDMNAGNGLFVIEPHGDLIEDILAHVPDHRVKDVILFDPADEGFPIAFNFLTAHSELERTLLASDLVAVFRQFSVSWGDIIDNLLHNAVLAFLSSTRGGTLLDLKHFLVDKGFRDEFLATVTDEEIRFYWQTEFPRFGGKPHGPLLTRLDSFLRSKLIRNIVAQKDNKLDFRRIMDDRKILLVKLTHGAIGEESSRMLGSLLIAKLYQSAISRQNIPEHQRSNFFIYADEAHHFIVPSLSLLLSGARKFRCSLLFSNQETRQITSRDPEILSSLMTNCYSRVCFRLDSDAELLAKSCSFFTAEHLRNLGVGEAVCRFEQSRHDFNLRTFPPQPVDAQTAKKRKTAIIEWSRSAYATARPEIDYPSVKQQRVTVIERTPGPTSPTDTPETNSAESRPDRPPQSDNHPRPHFGRNGPHHTELQAVIKRVAETYGFRVELEKEVLGGTGRVDVSLEKENLRIACEVSVTTTDYEVTNTLKCLTAGYDLAIVLVSNQKKLPLLSSKIQNEIPANKVDKVKVLGLTGLLGYLRELTAPTPHEQSEKPAGQRLNFAEACELLNIKSSTLYRWVREGRVPFYRPGREYQFDRGELLLIGKHDLSGKRKATVKLQPLGIDKTSPKGNKDRESRYRKMLKLD